MLANQPPTERWTLLALVAYSWLPGEIRNSPIVDEDGTRKLFIGIGY